MDSTIAGALNLTRVASESSSGAEDRRTTRHINHTHSSSHRLLRTSLSAACIVTGALLIADGAVAQSGGASQRSETPTLSAPNSPQVFSTPRKRSSGSFWTPERMRDAELMDLPLVSPDEVRTMLTPKSLPEPGEGRKEPGAPPSIDVGPDFENYLFEPLEPEPEPEPELELEPEAGADFAPLAASTTGALFTNSRVFPREALTAYPYPVSGKLFFHDPVRNGNDTARRR